MISKIINDIVKYCFFIRKAFTHKLKPGLNTHTCVASLIFTFTCGVGGCKQPPSAEATACPPLSVLH